MPRMDGKGPMGNGSMTGGGRGRCILPVDEAPVRQSGAQGGQGGQGGDWSAPGGQGGGLRQMLRNCANAFCRFGGLGRGRGNGGGGNGGGGFGRQGNGRRGGGRGANGRNAGF
ncbi:hypothetical protein GTO91_05510 [Heliobacterium undosum]|uniref:Uncharacterized protein n=1 Tax=Heliomicrobium undosum TaxID=121734 RepID=A0A845KYW7_9FIRM|nr:DUF5320 domain-containing protein [Heliomicrobium undosum]MZP29167.1 hypothetical protein [Heliomicrobium undosum]